MISRCYVKISAFQAEIFLLLKLTDFMIYGNLRIIKNVY